MSTIKKIIKLLEERHISARKLTMDLNLANSSISEWKKEKAKPSIEAVIKIAKYFGVTTDYLLLDDVEMESRTEEAGGSFEEAKDTMADESDKYDNPQNCIVDKERYIPQITSDTEIIDNLSLEDRRLLEYFHKLDDEDRQYIWCKIVVLKREYTDS